MPFTPTYATAEQLRDFTGQTEEQLSDEAALAVLRKAEGDLDSLAVIGRPVLENGHRFDPDSLSDTEAAALTAACCAQAEYRLEMGPSFFIRGQHSEVSGPEFSTKGTLGRIGPQTMKELRAAPGLIRLTTTTTNRRGDLDPVWERA